MTAPVDTLAPVLAAFGIVARVVRADRLGDGHIHATWLVETEQDRRDGQDGRDGSRPRTRVVAQSLNAHVFPDLAACERNLRRIDAHLGDHHLGDHAVGGVRVPRLRRTVAGRVQWTDGDGATWRVSDYAEDTRAGTTARDADEASEAARAFGAYVCALASLPGGSLEDTIPRFHDLPRRVGQLDDAIRADRVGRLGGCTSEVKAATDVVGRVDALLEALPPLPVRTVHNDAKVANVLFDRATGAAAYVVDLDTTMDGTVLADVGELLRTASTVWPEDTADLAGLQVDDDRVEAVVRGFLRGSGDMLTPPERAALPAAGPLMAAENAVRFLADHLDGDRYFAISDPAHNLRRARAQLRVASLLLERCDLVERAAR